MKYSLTLSLVFFSFVSIAQTVVNVDRPVHRCEVMPAFGECVDIESEDANRCSSLAIMKHLGSEITYPLSAFESKISGTIYVSFIVELDGSVLEAKVMRSFTVDSEGAEKAISDLEAEALAAVLELPNFSPGTQDGEAVRVEMVTPVKFSLD